MRRSIFVLLVPCLAACPTGEIVPHAECGDGQALRGQGTDQHCAPADAGDSSVPPGQDSGPDSGVDSGVPDHSREACETCRRDIECALGHLCVPMYWRDELRDDLYCLPVRDPGCTWIYFHPILGREGTDDSAEICAPDEQLTTCEAVLDMQTDKRCDRATECGDPEIAEDGYCDHHQCTTYCDPDAHPNDEDCPEGWSCGAVRTCERPPI